MTRKLGQVALFATLTLLAGSIVVLASQEFDLITPQEYQQEKDAQKLVLRGAEKAPPVSERAADGPTIEVVTPDSRTVVKAPVDIDVRFEPGPGATIVLDTLKIRYGLIGIDVTDRIRKAATVTEHGIRAPGAQLPAGSHSMTVEISDSAGRKTKQGFKFKVQA